MTESIYVSQEEFEAEEARVTELKLEIPERREAIEGLEFRIEALLEKIPERRTEIERLRRSIRTHSGWVTRRREALSEYMGIISALGRRPDFLTRMALWARKEVVTRRLKDRSPAKTRADIDAREKEITRLWGRIGGLTSALHAEENELRTLRSRRAALIRWIREREAELAYEQERLTRKVVRPPLELSRVTLSLYLIIQEGSHVYPRKEDSYYEYRRPHYRRTRQRVRYPKGRFQSILECDCFQDPETGGLQTDIDPFMTLEDEMRSEVADEIMEEFGLKKVDSSDLTLGVVSTFAQNDDIGKPPFKVSISRTYGDTGKEWKTMIRRFIMTASEYEALTSGMDEYLEALEAME